jgi:hypothetical protein
VRALQAHDDRGTEEPIRVLPLHRLQGALRRPNVQIALTGQRILELVKQAVLFIGPLIRLNNVVYWKRYFRTARLIAEVLSHPR